MDPRDNAGDTPLHLVARSWDAAREAELLQAAAALVESVRTGQAGLYSRCRPGQLHSLRPNASATASCRSLHSCPFSLQGASPQAQDYTGVSAVALASSLGLYQLQQALQQAPATYSPQLTPKPLSPQPLVPQPFQPPVPQPLAPQPLTDSRRPSPQPQPLTPQRLSPMPLNSQRPDDRGLPSPTHATHDDLVSKWELKWEELTELKEMGGGGFGTVSGPGTTRRACALHMLLPPLPCYPLVHPFSLPLSPSPLPAPLPPSLHISPQLLFSCCSVPFVCVCV